MVSASKDQKFTVIQAEYVLASRRAANSFLRTVIYLATIALVIIAGLGLRATQAAKAERIARQSEQVAKEDASGQRNEAVKQRNQAQRTAQTFATVDNNDQTTGRRQREPSNADWHGIVGC
ncbi:MAG TPA: hypothetical protein VHO69_09775 [Phototrophicaceae bacterium]|nr:hypothetical protein [Phototrophicaceae bacterium]